MAKMIIAVVLAFALPSTAMAQENTEPVQQSSILGKLQTKLPKINLNNTTLDEAVEFLRLRALELDRSKARNGINFVLTHPNPEKAIIKNLDLTNVTFLEALNAICLQTKSSYDLDKFAIVIRPHSADPPKKVPGQEMIQQKWTTPGDFLAFITPPAARNQEVPVPKLLGTLGVSFPGDSGASYLASSHTLIARNTRANLDVINQIVGASQNPAGMVKDQKMVEEIILGQVAFYNTTLDEALMFLRLRANDKVKIKIAGDDEKLARTILRSLSLTDISLPVALKYICELSNTRFVQHGRSFIILPEDA